jgi:UDP-N-acetylmuramoyl-tripeptide--D-alanyl-D-alanine ligase
MSALWTSNELALAVSGAASTDFAVSGVTFDSREVGPGDLFIALTGESTNGHRFLDTAFAAGAAGAIVSAETAHPAVRVTDTFAALNDLARASRARSQARICGVTGSVGKTGTKEALFAALDRGAPGSAHRSVKELQQPYRAFRSASRGCRARRPLRRLRDGHEPCRRARAC